MRERRARTALAAGRAFGRAVTVAHRPDGRPEVPGGHAVSASHGAGLTLFAADTGAVACDVETVAARSAADWAGLLGPHEPLAGLVAAQAREDGRDAACTRVWTALECLRKAGLPADAPLALIRSDGAGWTVFGSGGLRVCTFVTALRDAPDPAAFAILVEGRS
ncbi:hypothetical protein ACFQHO_11005 [Actinomadura yumaensis]